VLQCVATRCSIDADSIVVTDLKGVLPCKDVLPCGGPFFFVLEKKKKMYLDTHPIMVIDLKGVLPWKEVLPCGEP